MSAVEDARAKYADRAAAAPSEPCYRFRWYGRCRPCGRPHLAVDAASLDLDIAMAEALPYRGPSAGLLGGAP